VWDHFPLRGVCVCVCVCRGYAVLGTWEWHIFQLPAFPKSVDATLGSLHLG
jgi:hypothetical protein